uniref:Uncharacterized protein n=1 Tax=Anguilla anguilla TaxID=7936 RepID=A0A0E9S6D4_ANGAN
MEKSAYEYRGTWLQRRVVQQSTCYEENPGRATTSVNFFKFLT